MTHQATVIGFGTVGKVLVDRLRSHPSISVKKIVSRSADPADLPADIALQRPAEGMREPRDELVFCTYDTARAVDFFRDWDISEIGKLIDFSALSRFRNPDSVLREYGIERPSSAGKIEHWRYGLPELFAERLSTASRVSNPGCLATAALLSVAPFCSLAEIDPAATIALNGIIGLSGARSPAYLETQGVRSAKFGRHPHSREIVEVLDRLFERRPRICFNGATCPVRTGIHLTATFSLKENSIRDRTFFLDHAAQFYSGYPLIKVSEEAVGTAHCSGNDEAHISLCIDQSSSTLSVVTILDNLGKGGAGQAIQNANLMLGLPVNEGLVQRED